MENTVGLKRKKATEVDRRTSEAEKRLPMIGKMAADEEEEKISAIRYDIVTYGLNALLRFKQHLDRLHSIINDFQTAAIPQWIICEQCDVTFKPQPARCLTRNLTINLTCNLIAATYMLKNGDGVQTVAV